MAGKLKWLGHATFTLTSPGDVTVVFDPWVKDSPVCPLKLEDIKKADIVLVSHDHFDHSTNAVDIARQTGAIVVAQPETAGRFKAQLGLPEEQVCFGGFGMNIGGTAEIKGIRITMTQAFHSSATGNPSGYLVKLEDGTTVYHAGDTGIFDSMGLLAEMYGIDVALLPIGDVFTMDPVQAARALRLLQPKVAIPMHFGTFPILEQDASRFVELAKKEAPEVQVVTLEPGQEHTL